MSNGFGLIKNSDQKLKVNSFIYLGVCHLGVAEQD